MATPLPEKQFKLLSKMMNNRKIFDQHDNCLQVSLREASKALKVTYSEVQRLCRELQVKGLMNSAVDIYDMQRLMVNPSFLYFHTKQDKRFHRAMYSLGSHENAVEWVDMCRELDEGVNPETGEMFYFNAKADIAYANSYGCNDRDKIHHRDNYQYTRPDGDGIELITCDKEVY